MAHDQLDAYRGLYEWDEPSPTEHYARCLRPVLVIVSVPGSFKYRVLPGLRRDRLLEDPHLLDDTKPPDQAEWWRPVQVS